MEAEIKNIMVEGMRTEHEVLPLIYLDERKAKLDIPTQGHIGTIGG